MLPRAPPHRRKAPRTWCIAASPLPTIGAASRPTVFWRGNRPASLPAATPILTQQRLPFPSPSPAAVNTCAECRPFIAELQALEKDVFPYDSPAALHADQNLCSERMSTDAYKKACMDVAAVSGLHMVPTILASVPQKLCAALDACEDEMATAAVLDGDLLLSAEVETQAGLFANLALGALGGGEEAVHANASQKKEDAHATVALETSAKTTDASKLNAENQAAILTAAKLIAKAKAAQAQAQTVAQSQGQAQAGSTVNAGTTANAATEMMQMRQMNEMKRQQAEMMQMQMMRMRMMSIMSSNRDLKKKLRTEKRHLPGGCDCCMACTPGPATGSV